MPALKVSHWFLVLIILAACQPVSPASIPAPQIIQVRITPPLAWLGVYSNACALSVGDTAIIFDFRPAPDLFADPAVMAMRWGPPPELDLPAYTAGSDELVFLVHPDNPVQSITLDQIRSIYAGQATAWSDVAAIENSPVQGDIHSWEYPQGDDVQEIFEAFSGARPRPTPLLMIAPDPQAVRLSVANDPQAIGYIPRRWLDETVRVLPIENLNGENPYSGMLRQPVVVIVPGPLTAKEQAWLKCLQDTVK